MHILAARVYRSIVSIVFVADNRDLRMQPMYLGVAQHRCLAECTHLATSSHASHVCDWV